MTDLLEVELTFTDQNDFARHYFDDVPKIALAVYREYGTSEPDDITQAISEGVIKNFERSFSGVEREEVLKRFRRLGRDFAWREAIDYQYFSGNFIYSPEDVRRMLSDALIKNAETISEAEYKVDLVGAFEQLTTKRRRAIYKHYGLGFAVKELSKPEKDALYRGVDDMTSYLNRSVGVKALRIDAGEIEL